MTQAQPLPRGPYVVAALAGTYAIVGGALTLAGWAFDLPRLTAWQGSAITMKANTAIAAMTGGAALLLTAMGSHHRLMRVCAWLTATIGGLTLLQHLTGWNLGIDTLLFTEPSLDPASVAPQRMGPPASTSYTLLGAGLLLLHAGARGRRVASALAMAVVAIATLSLVGYFYGSRSLYGVAQLTGIAFQTATMLAALGIGLMAALPERGIVATLRRDDAGGLMFRRLLPALILLSIAVGWVSDTGEKFGYYDSAFGTAIRTILEIAVFTALLWWTASGISHHAVAARTAHDALVEADRRKDEFLATLAHELRNPLAPIRTGLQVLRTAGRDSAHADQALTIMERQLAQLVHLVDDLLDLSRVTRGLIDLRREPVRLSRVLDQAIETSRPHIEARAHALNVHRGPDDVVIDADPIRLAQVFTNLLNNAAKYTAPRGRIAIKVERDGTTATVRVSDNGAGIAPERLPSIFDMFRQSDVPAGAAGREGLGIGLTLVKRLVEMHGGQVDAASEGVGKGSTFTVRLPAVSPAAVVEAASPAPSASPAPASGGRRILVVDDNRDVLDSFATLLRIRGHTVHTAQSGSRGLRYRAARPERVRSRARAAARGGRARRAARRAERIRTRARSRQVP